MECLKKSDAVEAVARRCSIKKVLLEISQSSQKNTCVRATFLIKVQAEPCIFIKKEILAQEFSDEFWEIFNNTLQDISGGYFWC